jgi:hypothetical protein
VEQKAKAADVPAEVEQKTKVADAPAGEPEKIEDNASLKAPEGV